MSRLDQRQSWRQRLGWLASELLVVFAGVSAAFVVENYRDNRKQIAEMHQAIAGIITELTSTETKARKYSDAILADIARWEDADRTGKRAVPVITEFLAHHIHHQQRGTVSLHLA
jgi:hypothetical protein